MSNYVHKVDCKVEGLEVFTWSSNKSGAIGLNTIYSFSSSAFNFPGPN